MIYKIYARKRVGEKYLNYRDWNNGATAISQLTATHGIKGNKCK